MRFRALSEIAGQLFHAGGDPLAGLAAFAGARAGDLVTVELALIGDLELLAVPLEGDHEGDLVVLDAAVLDLDLLAVGPGEAAGQLLPVLLQLEGLLDLVAPGVRGPGPFAGRVGGEGGGDGEQRQRGHGRPARESMHHDFPPWSVRHVSGRRAWS